MTALTLTLAQAAAGDGSDTTVIVAVIGGVAVVLGALVSLFGLRLGARLDTIEKAQASLGAAIDRLERRMEDGLARLADRIDRLYGSAPARPAPPTPSEDLERFKRFIVSAPPSEEGERFERSIAERTSAGPSAAELNAHEAFRQAVEEYLKQERQKESTGEDVGPNFEADFETAPRQAEVEFLLDALRQAVEGHSEEQEGQEGHGS